MTNREFIKHLMKTNPGLFRDDAQRIVQIVFSGMRSVLIHGESLNIPGLGTLSPEYVDQKGTTWTNPATGEVQKLDDKFRLRFVGSRKFEKALTDKMMGIADVTKEQEQG
jgi:nucleoid DNA-binding protein